MRVGAHTATSILVMLTEVDKEESGSSTGSTDHSASIRCVLALRNVITSNGFAKFNSQLRIVVEMDSACAFIEEGGFVTPDGRQVLYVSIFARRLRKMIQRCGTPCLVLILCFIFQFRLWLVC